MKVQTRLCGVTLLVATLLQANSILHAQDVALKQTDGRSMSSRSLPDTPLPNLGLQDSAQQTHSAEGSASVAGTVIDASGASVPGAEIGLTHEDGAQLHTMVSDANGEFNFANILPGSYLVTVNAQGFAPFSSTEFVVAARQAYEVPDVLLSVATKNTEVTVRPTDLIAAEQIRAAEKQRLMGIIPNFYTSYIYDTAPLTAKQKFRFATRGTFDPVSLIGVGFGAGRCRNRTVSTRTRAARIDG